MKNFTFLFLATLMMASCQVDELNESVYNKTVPINELINQAKADQEVSYMNYLNSPEGQEYLARTVQLKDEDGNSNYTCNCYYKINKVEFDQPPVFDQGYTFGSTTLCEEQCAYFFTQTTPREECLLDESPCVDLNPLEGSYYNFNCNIEPYSQFDINFFSFMHATSTCTGSTSSAVIKFEILCCDEVDQEEFWENRCGPTPKCYSSGPLSLATDPMDGSPVSLIIEMDPCGCQPTVQ